MSGIDQLLARPPDQRRREYQYRFAQSVVFGLPVLALEWFGRSLGGAESDRWVAILQAALAGWVLYVGAAGMFFEGLLLLARVRLGADLLPAFVAGVLYVLGLVRATRSVVGNPADNGASFGFHWVVLVLIVWTGGRWGWLKWRGRG